MKTKTGSRRAEQRGLSSSWLRSLWSFARDGGKLSQISITLVINLPSQLVVGTTEGRVYITLDLCFIDPQMDES